MNIILFGPPGAGKGTQADAIVKDFNFLKVSTGDLLRKEINKNTILGNKIKSIIDKGNFVSDETINDLIKDILTNKKYFNKIIFDGYPRNLNQAKSLDKLVLDNNQKISCVLSLKVDQDTVLKRILGREICSKCGKIFNKFFNPSTEHNHPCGQGFLKIRSDDKKEVILERFKTYTKETHPILDHYKSQNLLYEIDGISNIVKISQEIRQIIRSLDAWLCRFYQYK